MNPHAQRIREGAIAERLREVRARLAIERREPHAAGLPDAAFDRSLSIEQRRAALTAAGFGRQRHCHPGRPWHSHPGGADIHDHRKE